MSAAGLLLLSVLAVPPGEPVIDHNQPGQWGHQPVVRYFVRRPVDDARGRGCLQLGRGSECIIVHQISLHHILEYVRTCPEHFVILGGAIENRTHGHLSGRGRGI